MAQLNSASDFGSEGWGFESLRGHKKVLFLQDFFYFKEIINVIFILSTPCITQKYLSIPTIEPIHRHRFRKS